MPPAGRVGAWLRVLVYLNERVYMEHQGLGTADDELVNTGDGMRPETERDGKTETERERERER